MRPPTVRAVAGRLSGAVADAVADADLQVGLDGALVADAVGARATLKAFESLDLAARLGLGGGRGEARAGLFGELSEVALLPGCRPVGPGVGVVVGHGRAISPAAGRTHAPTHRPAG